MARHLQQRDLGLILTAARTWINDCLVADRALFSAGELWTPALVEEVRAAFVDHPDHSDDRFMVKLARQMAAASKAAKQLTAECLWGLFIFPLEHAGLDEAFADWGSLVMVGRRAA
ncbi:MAG: hypothetical protein R2712_12265 [Vicinamibacterales bacterium]